MIGKHMMAFIDIKQQLEKYLEKIAPRAGFSIKTLDSIGDESAELTFVFKVDEKAELNTKEAAEFLTLCSHYGLKREHLGAEYRSFTKSYILIGMNQRSTKYPALGRDTKTGKVFKTMMPKADQFLI